MLMTHPERHAILVELGWTPHGDFLGNDPGGPYVGHTTSRTMFRSADGRHDLPLMEAYAASGHAATPTHAIEWRPAGEGFRRLVVDGVAYEGTHAYMEASMRSVARTPMYDDGGRIMKTEFRLVAFDRGREVDPFWLYYFSDAYEDVPMPSDTYVLPFSGLPDPPPEPYWDPKHDSTCRCPFHGGRRYMRGWQGPECDLCDRAWQEARGCRCGGSACYCPDCVAAGARCDDACSGLCHVCCPDD